MARTGGASHPRLHHHQPPPTSETARLSFFGPPSPFNSMSARSPEYPGHSLIASSYSLRARTGSSANRLGQDPKDIAAAMRHALQQPDALPAALRALQISPQRGAEATTILGLIAPRCSATGSSRSSLRVIASAGWRFRMSRGTARPAAMASGSPNSAAPRRSAQPRRGPPVAALVGTRVLERSLPVLAPSAHREPSRLRRR